MNKKICVYTCITGGYDNLHEIEKPEKDVDYYCFTNNKKLKSKTWKIVQIDDDGLDNCRLARKTKILGHPLINEKYKIHVWTDADVIWRTRISDFAKTYLKEAPFAIFKHHARSNVLEEAKECLRCRKESKENIERILNYYKEIDFPDKIGLFESTVFVKRVDDKKVNETMQIWFEMIKTYSKRDQLSFPYAIWKTGLSVDVIDLNVWDNDWFATERHTAEKKVEDCHIYYGDTAQDIELNKYHVVKFRQDGARYRADDVVAVDTDRIEINPTDIVGMNYEQIDFAPNSRCVFQGLFEYKDKHVFCGSCSTVLVFGEFKRGQKISFSIKMNRLTNTEIVEFMEQAVVKDVLQKRELEQQSERIYQLEKQLSEIRNSRLWRGLSHLGKIIHRS